MARIPEGTVTLLFSDIEGSTALLSRLGPAYVDALDAHHGILRQAWTAHDGTEMGTGGDSFFVAFDAAADAVSAAVQAQRDLARFAWPDGEDVRVRMGLHTGTPTVHAGDYLGMDVHRCARIAAAAHGGQVVVSDATAHLLDQPRDGDGLALRDLGFHRLKDLPELERLYQVEAEGLLRAFPPLRSLGATSRLPVPATPLVGREVELTRLAALLSPGPARLVMLTGPAGAGKTRLALELARSRVGDFPGGVHFLPVADLHTADQLWDALAEALGTAPDPEHVLSRLRSLRALLVLDNLEQLAGGDRVVADVLRGASEVAVVATSRRPLHLADEHQYPVAPLAMPSDDSLAAAKASPAVQLFVQQGRRVRPGFDLSPDNAADVAALCRRLDGLPLAIEIAGARVKVLPPRALADRLGTGLDLSTTVGGVTERQRTLRGAIAWSYDLLTTELQAAFARLGVFDGGADLQGLAAALDDAGGPVPADPLDVLTSLVDASLATVDENFDDQPRIALLETVRAFAVDRLAADGCLEAVRARHAAHYLQVVETLGPQLQRDHFGRARDALDVEQGNVRAALRWCLDAGESAGTDAGRGAGTDPREQPDRSALAVALGAGLCSYWDAGTKYAEARQWLEPVVAGAGGTPSPELGACLTFLAKSVGVLGEPEEALERARAAVAMHRGLGDAGLGLADALLVLAGATLACGDPAGARPFFEEALEVARHETGTPYRFVDSLAFFEGVEGHHERALELHTEAAVLAGAAGDPTAAHGARHNAACELRLLGRPHEAAAAMTGLVPDVLTDRIPMDTIVFAEDFGAVLADLGRHREAVELLGAADAMRERQAYPREPWQQDELRDAYAASEQQLGPQGWKRCHARGRAASVQALLEAYAPE
jgi:predicted ATPase/class 3 adenylate cyclase